MNTLTMNECRKAHRREPRLEESLTKAIGALAGIFLVLALTGAGAEAKSLYVSASAAPGGDGSRSAPFNSLAAIEKTSAPGDEIVVLASPTNVAPLNGGIALKPNQKLTGDGPPVTGGAALAQAPRITNSDATSNSGDAVVLADNTEVSNLVIVNSFRGGIYGADVTDVKIHDNNLSGTNTSCTPGFYVYFPGATPLLANGWAAIMADEQRGILGLAVWNNLIHDGTCNDGIDIRATGTAVVTARVDSNNITHLAQGPKMRSLLGIGMQTRDNAVLNVDSDQNSLTYIGSPNADCEGFFTSQTGGSISWNITRSTFAHGIGGRSCNGGEFYIGSGSATTNVYVSHSLFEDDPGDMIQEVNAGTGSTMNLTLNDVTVRHTTSATQLPPEPKFTSGLSTDDNVARCVDQDSWGHQNVNNLRIFNSRLLDCVGDGIGSIASGTVQSSGMNFGDAVGASLSIDVENSIISGSQQYALHFTNHTAMKQLSIRVQGSQLSDARGLAGVAFDQDASTEHAEIDLGGTAAGGTGGNCLIGAANLAVEVTGYDVHAGSNWWGSAGGPAPAKVSVTNGTLVTSPALRQPPPACKAK